jgi:hypothetical protein
MLTVEEIQNMSDAERAAMNTRLAKKAMKRYALILAVKWGIIIGLRHAVKKL